MDQQKYQMELIAKAQRGDRQSMDELAAMAQERLRTYVYRMTQDEDLSQEIVQEALFEMCKVLGKLRDNEKFWPWLHGIATNKLKRFYRTERKQRNLMANSVKQKNSTPDHRDGLDNLVSEELKGIVSAAIKRLRTRHRAVLIMRCYDGMSHSEIAESLGCSEFGTRMLFLRAKRALQKELSQNGFAKGSLLTALVVFGRMTAPSKAAAAKISVTSAATKVGLLTEVAVLSTTKTAMVSVAAAGAIAAGTIVAPSVLDSHEMPNSGHFAAQFGSNSKAREHYLQYFPGGPGRALILRANSDPAGGMSEREILQDEYFNYDYHDNTIHINNHRMYAADLSVPVLPTDDPEMVKFLQQVVPGNRDVGHVSKKGNSLLVSYSRNNGEKDLPSAVHNRNALQEHFFQPDWPTTNKLDRRDEMHKRGWTYFRIRGQINGQKVMGAGRIPFVYGISGKYSPWLKLQVGSLTIIDDCSQACVLKEQSDQPSIYPPGSFFRGMARQWMGLHTLDTVRRDAAEQRIWFETRYIENDRFAEVKMDFKAVKITYKIDLYRDMIDEIIFTTGQGKIGNMKFYYPQSIRRNSSEFEIPNIPTRGITVKDNGLRWLAKLAQNSLE